MKEPIPVLKKSENHLTKDIYRFTLYDCIIFKVGSKVNVNVNWSNHLNFNKIYNN